MPDDTPDEPTLKSQIEDTMRTLVAARGAAKTICPSEVARAIAGKDEKAWRLLMKPIRSVAVEQALAGDVVVKRKGKVVDPTDFRGVYRIGPAE